MPKFAHLRLHRNDDNSIECRGGITLAYEPAEQGGYKYASMLKAIQTRNRSDSSR